MSTRTRFWLSWYEKSEDYRPLNDPPNERILGWWNTGFSPGYTTIVALVEAYTEEAAWAAVEGDWPGASKEIRFCEDKGRDYVVTSDRYPLKDWEKQRMGL